MRDGQGWLLPMLGARSRAATAMVGPRRSSPQPPGEQGDGGGGEGAAICSRAPATSPSRGHGGNKRRKQARHRSPQKASYQPRHGGEGRDAEDSLSSSFLPGLDQETALQCLAFASRADYRSLASVSRTHLRLVRSPLLYELRRSHGIAEPWVYMYTNSSRGWTALDPKRRLWINVPPANTHPTFLWSDRESLCAGSHLLWLGKEISNFVVYKYDLITNSWGGGPAMNMPRCLFASASCKHIAYVAGGFSEGTLAVLRSAEVYNSLRGEWDLLPDMNLPRQKCSGCYMDGKFYVIGGKDANHEPITSGEEYDPGTRTWRLIPDMYPTPQIQRGTSISSPPLVAVMNNQLYAIESSTNCLKAYDKRANTWSLLGQVPVRADIDHGWGLAFKALEDELLVIGRYRDHPHHDGIAVYSWRPGHDGAAPDWKPVARRFVENGTFLYNCTVMAC